MNAQSHGGWSVYVQRRRRQIFAHMCIYVSFRTWHFNHDRLSSINYSDATETVLVRLCDHGSIYISGGRGVTSCLVDWWFSVMVFHLPKWQICHLHACVLPSVFERALAAVCRLQLRTPEVRGVIQSVSARNNLIKLHNLLNFAKAVYWSNCGAHYSLFSSQLLTLTNERMSVVTMQTFERVPLLCLDWRAAWFYSTQSDHSQLKFVRKSCLSFRTACKRRIGINKLLK